MPFETGLRVEELAMLEEYRLEQECQEEAKYPSEQRQSVWGPEYRLAPVYRSV